MQKISGGGVQTLKLDITKTDLIEDSIKAAASMFPENRIDILVNSAGLISRSDFLNITEEEYDRTMNVNLKGTFFVSQIVAKMMIEKNVKGHILNLSSSSSLRPAGSPYRMSKWAIRGLTLGMAEQLLPYGIIVNAIAPGPVATPMMGREQEDSLYKEKQPSGRYAVPSEIAALAVFMASDMGNLIVGDTFYITGGSGTVSLQY